MARRTVHIPDDLDSAVCEFGGVEDSYSAIVQAALRSHLADETGPSDDD